MIEEKTHDGTCVMCVVRILYEVFIYIILSLPHLKKRKLYVRVYYILRYVYDMFRVSYDSTK